MRKNLFCACAALGIAFAGSAGAVAGTPLPQPEKTAPFAQRQSAAAFSEEAVPEQTLSTLLWAANGINRANGKRTAATAMNKQEIEIFVIRADGAFLAKIGADEVSLEARSKKDLRAAVAGMQVDFAKAPLMLLLVADMEKFSMMPQEHAFQAACIDTGGVMQNILLSCAQLGLGSRPRISMDKDALVKELGLGEKMLPLLNVVVGVPAEPAPAK